MAERPYKNLPATELHKLKNNPDVRQEHRSYAEAEIDYRKRFWRKFAFISAAGIVILALISFFVNSIK